MVAELIKLLKESMIPPGPSGFEDEIRSYITRKLEEIGLQPSQDNMGNVYLSLGQKDYEETLVIAAHMDEIGLLVTGIDEKGKLYFITLGGVPLNMLDSMHVKVKTENGYVPGIIGIIPPHLKRDDKQPSKLEDYRIDIGAEAKDEAADLGIEPPSPAVLEHKYVELRGGEVIAGRPLDDRVGVAILLKLAGILKDKRVKNRKIILAWTVQEEIGLKGAYALSHMLNADYMIAIDTITCCRPPYTGGYGLGKGPVLRLVDRAYVSCIPLSKWIMQQAKDSRLSLQIAVAQGGTDAAAGTHAGICSTAITVATENTHSTVEKAYKRDIELSYELLERVVEEYLEKGITV
ncbi:MAG: M20/M25/M40 family metallo-hydrolase [Desulfurococcales archaeon]|nr:M20/M25/M40 family metallo-hydrolase [Desulfurococcales archaeon]